MKQMISMCMFKFIVLTSLGTQAMPASEKPMRPDVLFILIDDLRWDALSYKGHPYVETPHLDRLRQQGADIENTFVTTSICCPSRATFLTGTYANRHGVIDNETSEYHPHITPPLTKQLQEAGYITAMIGKWHMGHSDEPRAFFDHWISFKGQGTYHDLKINRNGKHEQWKGYTTDLLTAEAIAFIEAQPKDQPFFCMLSHKAVHEPFIPHERHQNAFGAKQTDIEPKSWSSDFAGKPKWHRRQHSRDVRWAYRTRAYEQEHVPKTIQQKEWPKNQKKYIQQFRCLPAVDEGVGRIMKTLEKRGNLENTLIVFTSDNGYFHGEHRRWDKRLAHEESMRIPMIIVYPPAIEAGSTITQLVTNLDFAPTVLDFTGIEIPELMQGLSMKLLFQTESAPWRDTVFYEYWVELVHSIPTMIAARTDTHKLIHYPEMDDIDELYDLKKDPHEMNNLAAEKAYYALYHDMQTCLSNQIEQTGWRINVFPKNLPRVRGKEYLKQKLIHQPIAFSGKKKDLIKTPYNMDADPSSWPWKLSLSVKPDTDGTVISQSNFGYGFQLFFQDGRPGIAVRCKTWILQETVIDAPDSAIGKWTHIEAMIDYNRVQLNVNGELIESRALPLPFKARIKQPLMIGGVGAYAASKNVPSNPFKGKVRALTIERSPDSF